MAKAPAVQGALWLETHEDNPQLLSLQLQLMLQEGGGLRKVACDTTAVPSDLFELMGPDIEDLSLSNSGRWELDPFDPAALGNLKSLKKLRLSGYLTDAVAEVLLAALPSSLEELALTSCGRLNKLPRSISRLSALRKLSLTGSHVDDVSPLAGLTKLQALHLRGSSQLRDVTPLAALVALRRLDLAYTAITDASPLQALVGLEEICLTGTNVTDVASLLDALPTCDTYE
jgi:Leucine-rich repeat (LRR) protein